MGLKLVRLPPSSQELNPAERVFEEVRRVVEGAVYGTIERKGAAVEDVLRGMAINAERLKRLVGWDWVLEALVALPRVNTVSG